MKANSLIIHHRTAFFFSGEICIGVVWLFWTLALWAQPYPCDLTLYGGPPPFTSFLPSVIAPGAHPTSYTYTVWNSGPYPSYAGVLTDFYLSRDPTFGNGDDIWIGQRQDFTSAFYPGSATTTVSSSNGIANITIPLSASGPYYVFVRVTPASSLYSYDPNLANNYAPLSDSMYQPTTIMVGNPPPSVTSIVRLNPPYQTNNQQFVTWRVTFSEQVFSVDLGDFTPVNVSGGIYGYYLAGLNQSGASTFDVTLNSGFGDGTLRLDVLYPPATIVNGSGQPLTTSFTSGDTFVIDRTPPSILSVGNVSPNPRATPVTNVDFTMSEPISGTTSNAVSLTLNGTPVSLSGWTITSLSGTTYRVNGLNSFTSASGTYTFTVNGAGIGDFAGNTCTNSMSTTWVKWATSDGIIYVDKAFAGSNSDGTLSSPFKTVTDGYQASQNSNTITMFTGNYNEAIVVNKQLLLQATNGTVNIGIP